MSNFAPFYTIIFANLEPKRWLGNQGQVLVCARLAQTQQAKSLGRHVMIIRTHLVGPYTLSFPKELTLGGWGSWGQGPRH